MGKNEKEGILLLLLLLFTAGIAVDFWLNHRPLPGRSPGQTPEQQSPESSPAP